MARERLADALGAFSRRLFDAFGRLGRTARRNPVGAVAAMTALLVGSVVLLVATRVFPYHSLNHDEGVYLTQAAMLLEGQLRLYPGDLVEAFRPWFFVRDGTTLYPKYSPVPAAMFAVGLALGEPRLALAAVAAGLAWLTYLLGSTAFDRPTGLLAAVALVGSPLFLFTGSVFLPYAPTALLNAAFALAYVRAHRRRSRRWGALAGAAVGLAFFARPYTAVLFAAPFIAHALWTFVRARADRDRLRTLVVRNGVVAALGLAGVCVTLAYNAVVTGSPWLFPYEAFAPLDGLGFGQRRILAHEVRYTPELAVRANARVLWQYATNWVVAGPVGAALALVGLGAFLLGGRTAEDDTAMPPRDCRAVLAGLFLTVPLGNVYFWGNYNVLADLGDPTDGLVSTFGPYYHFDLLVPTAVFAAAGAVTLARRVHALAADRLDARTARVVLAVVLVVSLPVVAVAERDAVGPPLERNREVTEKYERAYAAVERHDFDRGLTFVPTPYGDWQHHPFQWLRNDPGFDGDVVYALDRGPDEDWAVVDAYPDRRLYRYTYNGEWTPDPDRHVVPTLERLRVREGAALVGTTTVGVVPNTRRGSVRVSNGEVTATYALRSVSGETVTVRWVATPDGVALRGENVAHVTGPTTVPITGADEISVATTLAQPGGATVTYRQEVTARVRGETVQAIWPPEESVCRLTTDCGTEGTYLPDRPWLYVDGVDLSSRLAVTNQSAQAVSAD